MANVLYSRVVSWNVMIIFGILYLTATNSQQIPSLITKGNHHDVGYNVGSTFRHSIQAYYKEHPFLRPVWLPWSQTPEGEKVVKGLMYAAQTYFPQYVAELNGMAKGANVSFLEMFLANHYVELSAILKTRTADSCSDIFVNYPEKGSVLLAHNEDNTPLIQNKAYILTATIVSDTGGGVLEQFTAYCYPGQLPGNAFGFNEDGLILSVNGLYPKLVKPQRVGRTFLTRAMLAARDLASVIEVVQKSSAYGLSANYAFLKQDKSVLYNLEVAPNAIGNETVLNVHQVKAEGKNGTTSDRNYFHVNMYRRISISEIPSHIESSIHRTARINNFTPPSSLEEIQTILGDTKDPDFPIYRTPRPTDEEVTLATAVFDLQRCSLAMYVDNPKTSTGPLTVFNLPCSA